MTQVTARLLIVDDESAQMRALCDTLGVEGYATQGFSSARQALAALRPGEFDLLITDLMMPEMDGITLIDAARKIDSSLGAIVTTGHGTIDTAVQAMRGGALDYILRLHPQTVQAQRHFTGHFAGAGCAAATVRERRTAGARTPPLRRAGRRLSGPRVIFVFDLT